ncbi:hypothetical protein Tco_1382844, partial [Tanacetum coccineum]
MFLIRIHHGGIFHKYPGRRYVDCQVDIFDMVDIELFNVTELDEMVLELVNCWELKVFILSTARPIVSTAQVTTVSTNQLVLLEIEFNKFEFNLATYKIGLASMEEQRVFYKNNKLEKLKQEKESNQLKIEILDNASKSLDKLIGSQITDKSRKGVGFVSYNAVPPPPTGLFSPQKFDLSNSGLEKFQQPEFKGYGPKTSKSVSENISNEVRESPDAPLVEELLSGAKEGKITGKGTLKTVVTGTNSNDLVGTEESIGSGHSNKETRSSQDYILMPMWKDGSLFDSSLKNARNDEPQPSSDDEKKDDEGENKQSGINDQEKPKNSTQGVNTAGP